MKEPGPAFGCHPTNCHVITKEHLFEIAQQIFVIDEVETVDGCRALGNVFDSDNSKKQFEITKTSEFCLKAGLSCQCFTKGVVGQLGGSKSNPVYL